MTPEEKSEGFEVARGKVVDQSIRATQLHHRSVAPTIEPADVEGKLEFSIPMPDESRREFVGYYDLRETDETLRDSKTALKRPSAGVADKSDQLAIYSFALNQLYGVIPPTSSLDYMILSSAEDPTSIPIPKPKKGAAQMTTEQAMKAASAKLVKDLAKDPGATLLGLNGRDRAIRWTTVNGTADHARAVVRAQEAIAGIEAGFMPPASSGSMWCSPKMCGYYPTCPYVRGGAVITIPGVNA
jgi:hypothetical protein